MDHITDLVGQLHKIKNLLHGCESLSVASTDGLVLATTHDEGRKGEFVAAVTSLLLTNTASLLAPLKAGECRALDFRGDRQVLMVRLPDTKAYLICVQHPGAHAVNLDEPTLRAALSNVPNLLHAQDVARTRRWLLQRDKSLRFPVRNRLLVGRAHHCDVVLPSARVNAEHLIVEVVAERRLQATDLDTEHGTRLNGRAFDGCVELSIGDRLTLPRSGSLVVCAVDHEGRELGPDGRPVSARATRRTKTESRS
ncbi:MAG: FHA domain-containing protein [Planctomycetes bacterium]|nr:FHA domain-containing protein [Planctomycetota bacterium]